MSLPRNLVTAITAAALTIGMGAPAGASADLVNDLLGGVDETVDGVHDGLGGLAGQGGGGGSPTPAPLGGVPPNYVPPEHGTNPHGQGTVGVVDLFPEDTEPLDADGSSEDVVVGRSRGEQNGNSYHGKIVLISVLGMGIPGVTEVETDEGESTTGPVGPINSGLSDLCAASANLLCLSVLAMDSSTDSNGSKNSFVGTDANVGPPGFGVEATLLSSQGNISDNGTCQRSAGRSAILDASVFGVVTADILHSESRSKACNDGSGDTQKNTSSGVNVLGAAVPLPAPGCANGTPNTVFSPVLIAPLLSAVCNADDSNGAQDDAPYGVREALSVFVLPIVDLLKVTNAAGESAAEAPAVSLPVCPDPSNPACDETEDDDDRVETVGGGDQVPGGPGTADAGATLPFTGADLLTIALVGAGVMGLGLLGMALADRRRARA